MVHCKTRWSGRANEALVDGKLAGGWNQFPSGGICATRAQSFRIKPSHKSTRRGAFNRCVRRSGCGHEALVCAGGELWLTLIYAALGGASATRRQTRVNLGCT